MEPKYKAVVNDDYNFSLLRKEIESLDILSTTSSNKSNTTDVHIVFKNKSLKVEILHKDFQTRKYRLRINGNVYEVKIENELDALISKMGLSLGDDIITNEINAPMPGLIIEVNVSDGQEVKEGDFLCVLEAMKMENALISPRDGTIKSVLVSKGNTVDKGDLLIEFEG